MKKYGIVGIALLNLLVCTAQNTVEPLNQKQIMRHAKKFTVATKRYKYARAGSQAVGATIMVYQLFHFARSLFAHAPHHSDTTASTNAVAPEEKVSFVTSVKQMATSRHTYAFLAMHAAEIGVLAISQRILDQVQQRIFSAGTLNWAMMTKAPFRQSRAEMHLCIQQLMAEDETMNAHVQAMLADAMQAYVRQMEILLGYLVCRADQLYGKARTDMQAVVRHIYRLVCDEVNAVNTLLPVHKEAKALMYVVHQHTHALERELCAAARIEQSEWHEGLVYGDH